MNFIIKDLISVLLLTYAAQIVYVSLRYSRVPRDTA